MSVGAQFTAARFAKAIGMARNTFRRAMAGIEPTGRTTASGNETVTWTVSCLPPNLKSELEKRASAAPGCRNVEHFVSDFCAGYEPPRPIEDYSKEAVEIAEKYRAAFRPALTREAGVSAGESERRGVGEFNAAFGREISGKQWGRYLAKFKSRWRAEGDFHRLEIYIEGAKEAEVVAPVASEPVSGNIPDLEAMVRTFADPARATSTERTFLWERAFEYQREREDCGEDATEVRKRIVKFFRSFAQGVAKSERGLQSQFSRKLMRWEKMKRQAGAVEDQRHTKSGFVRQPPLNEKDARTILARATAIYNGKLEPAFRDCINQRLLEPVVCDYYKGKECPKKYRQEMNQAKREALADLNRGKSYYEKHRPRMRRDWTSVHANDWVQSDDLTPPGYFYIPDRTAKSGFRLLRGQLLAAMDLRSLFVTSFVLIPANGYTARSIRALFNLSADEHGLPRRGYYLENGMWRHARIVAGAKNDVNLSWPETEQGLREHGLEFIHAKPRNPQAKPIEGVFRMLQDQMFNLPGFCGREEKYDCPDRFKRLKLDVERGMSPVGILDSFQEANARYAGIIDAYNHRMQHGRMLPDLSPMQGYEKFANKEDPLTRYPEYAQCIFASQKYQVRVDRDNGVKIGHARYVCRATGELIGRELLAHYNPGDEDQVVLSDRNKKEFWVADRFLGDDIRAIDAGSRLSGAMKQAGDHQAPIKELYTAMKAEHPLVFRPFMTTRRDAQVCNEINGQVAASKAQREKAAKAKEKLRRDTTRIGLPAQIFGSSDADNAEALERLKRAGFNLNNYSTGTEAQP